MGLVSGILQMLKLPDGTVKVLVEGASRARIRSVTDLKSHWVAEAEPVPAEGAAPAEIEAMRRALLSAFDQYVKLNKKIPPEILTSLSGIDEGGRRCGRHGGRAPAAQARAEAAGAGDVRRQGAARAPAVAARDRDRHPAGREAHPRGRKAPDGEKP